MFDKSRMHLIPPTVEDAANNALNEKKNFNERSNSIVRLEAIKNYCEWVIERFERLTRKKVVK